MIKSSVKKRILFFCCLFLVALFLVYQIIILVLNGVITTETAISYTVYDEITADAVFIRSEQMIERTVEGVYNYSVSNGEKVSGGGNIAAVYADAASVENKIKIENLKKKREELLSIQNTGTNYSADIDLINFKIDADISSLTELIYSSKDLEGISDYSDDLLNQFNKKQFSTGYVSNFNNLILQLDTEVASLEALLTEPVSSITSPSSGYFVNNTDGFESIYSFESFDKLTVSALDSMLNAEPAVADNAIGRVITDDKWYTVCSVDSNLASLIKVGDTVVLNVPQVSISELDVKVCALNPDEASGKVVIVLECDYINDQIVNLRSESISIHANHYSGLRVSTESIRVVEGIQGVYVVSNNEAVFKPIDIIYSSVDYVICKIEEENKANSLLLYDEVITEGSNLYDGKVVK